PPVLSSDTLGHMSITQHPASITQKHPSMTPNVPEPTYWINLSLNDETANRMLWISEDGANVHEYSPQGIWGCRGYWEVEVNAGTPSGLGKNEEFWRLGWSGSCYQVWFKARIKDNWDIPQCSTFGVYVDLLVGVVSFYLVEEGKEGEEKEVKLLNRLEGPIKPKILPEFWVGVQSSCMTLKKPE
uniref:B30.2/SPRY domain-containing protein n=1 Tax=Oncorhynchus mykiss TaxID=8022 RepID=A0A8C7P7K7_ONCMY